MTITVHDVVASLLTRPPGFLPMSHHPPPALLRPGLPPGMDGHTALRRRTAHPQVRPCRPRPVPRARERVHR